MIITTLLQIPIAPMHQKYELLVLNQINKIHSDLPLAVANYELNVYHFLSMSDYASCYAAESSKIWQKREIRISPKLGCTLTRKNCKVWATEVIHDLTNSQILIYLENYKNATLACDGEKDTAVSLPKKAMLTLNVHCSLTAESFGISKLSYRHLKEVSNDLRYENIQFNLEHKALDRDTLADLAITSWIKTRMNVDKLLENNNKFKNSLEKQIQVSQSRWEQVSGSAYPWE